MNRYVCGDCNAAWLPANATLCPNCGSKSKVLVDQGWSAQAAPSGPQGVYITGIDVSWGDVFNIAFKFMVVFAVFQAVFLAIAIAVWR